MKKLFFLAAFIGLIFLAASCNNDDSVNPQPEQHACLITKLVHSGSDIIIYHYDAQKRLQKADYSGNEITAKYYKEYTYDGAGRVIKESFKSTDGETNGYFSFEYNGNDLLAKVYFYARNAAQDQLTLQYTKIVEYNASGQVVKVSTYHPDSTTPFRYDVYTYDTNQNVMKVEEYAQDGTNIVNDVTTEYTYDSKKNPYLKAIFLGLGAETLSKNNVATKKVTYHLSGLTKNFTNTYQYNEKEYPVKQTVTSDTQSYQVDREYSCAE